MKKTWKKIGAAILISVMSLTSALGAFAAENEKREDNGEAIILQKIFEVADNVTTLKDAKFEFTFVQVASGEEGSQLADEDKAEIPDATVTYKSDVDFGTKTMQLSYSDIFSEVEFPHAGEYVYKVTEKQNTYVCNDNETMTYSDAEYTLYVYVANTGEGGLEINHVLIKDAEGEKVDLLEFTNTYVLKTGSDETPALYVKKKVEGDYGNKTDAIYSFIVTVTPPETSEELDKLIGYINDDKTVEGTKNDDGSFTFTFNLAHGDIFYIPSLDVGTTYIVKEAGLENYTATANYYEAGQATSILIDASLDVGEDFELEYGFVASIEEAEEGSIKENGLEVVNTYNDESIVITGVLINNLPFILMILTAVIGLGAYLVIKRRRFV